MAEFQSELTFYHPVEQVFAFHSSPANVLLMLPGNVVGELVEAPNVVERGAEFEFRFGAMGMKVPLRLRIVEFEPGRLITDEQVRGPMKAWRQTHRFQPTPDGGTQLEYAIEFRPPGGMLGFMVTEGRILDGLKRLMPYRQEKTRNLLDEQFGPTGR